ncbi:hypothetical protein ACF0H5_011042 [Mactra antiquata]
MAAIGETGNFTVNEPQKLIKNVDSENASNNNNFCNQFDNVDTNEASVFDMALKCVGTINVKTQCDETDCCIEDSVFLDEHRMVVTDSYNKCVKLVDIQTGSVLAKCQLDSEPFASTSISKDCVAITQPTKNKIQFISVNGHEMSKMNHILVNGICGGLYYKDGKLAVSYRSPAKVEILDMNGGTLFTICGPGKNQDMFGLPGCVLLDNDRDEVIVSDYQRNKVVKVDFDGQILAWYEHADLKNPSGLTITKDGTIFACSETTHGLHAISRDFDRKKEILTNDKILQFPGIISYSSADNKLYINNNIEGKHGNTILIYQFVKT